MPNYLNAMQSPGQIIDADRAQLAWSRIQRDPTSIQLKRGSDPVMAAQTVRIEYSTASGTMEESPPGIAQGRIATVFGIKDHPTEDDTDIETGDRFGYGGAQFRVTFVATYPGEVQATCEAQM